MFLLFVSLTGALWLAQADSVPVTAGSHSSEAVLLTTLILGALTGLAKMIFDERREIRKEKRRLEELAEAREARESIKRLTKRGIREARSAYHEANNVNRKILDAHTQNAEVLREIRGGDAAETGGLSGSDSGDEDPD